MPKHIWLNRIAPPLVVVAVVGCVWYSLQSRPAVSVATPVQATPTQHMSTPSSTSVASAQPTQSAPPIVKKLGTQFHFSVATAQYKDVQKVEFYVEDQFVGAAYSQPFSVSVNENNLTAGSHTVTATIYTTAATAQTPAVAFTAQPTQPPAPVADITAPDPTPPATSTTPNAATVGTPQNVTALPNDSTSINVAWDAVDTAASYHVWRDSTMVATVTAPNYADTGLSAGQTYDYEIVAVNAAGALSDPSVAVAATTPMLGVAPIGGNTPDDPDSAANHSADTPEDPNTAT